MIFVWNLTPIQTCKKANVCMPFREFKILNLENAPDLKHAEGLGVTVSDQADQQHTSFTEFFIIVLFSRTPRQVPNVAS